MRNPSWPHPVVAGGRLYLREQDTLLRLRRAAEVVRSTVPSSAGVLAVERGISRLAVVAVLVLWPWTAFAQTTSGTITGTVRDTTGGVLPGARITARHPHTGLQRFTTSDGQGRYALPGLVVGSWDVRAELAGFRPADERGIVLTVAQTSVVDLQLEPGAAETTWVVADVPLVDTSSGQLSYLVNQKAIQELPLNGRNYTDLALLQPGVVAYPHRDGGSVVAHGLGHERQRPGSPLERLPARRNAAQRLHERPRGQRRRHRAGHGDRPGVPRGVERYSAEFGRNSGGQINVITKSGTNDSTAASTSSTVTTRSTRATTSTSPANPNSAATSSAPPWVAPCRRTRRSSSWATRACARTSAGRSRQPSSPTRTRAAACFPTRLCPVSCATSA